MKSLSETLRQAGDANCVTDDLVEFLGEVEKIGRDPAIRQSSETQTLLRETASLIANARVSLGAYVDETARLARAGVDWSGDQWRSLCKRRSAIEYVRELYRDIASVDWDVSFMDTDDLDIAIRGIGDDEGGLDAARIPSGTPASHWWWWYPQR